MSNRLSLARRQNFSKACLKAMKIHVIRCQEVIKSGTTSKDLKIIESMINKILDETWDLDAKVEREHRFPLDNEKFSKCKLCGQRKIDHSTIGLYCKSRKYKKSVKWNKRKFTPGFRNEISS